MDVTPRDPDDRSRLAVLIRREKDAMQRDRYRAIALALDGEMTRDIEVKLGRSKAFVQRWGYDQILWMTPAQKDGGVPCASPTQHRETPPCITLPPNRSLIQPPLPATS